MRIGAGSRLVADTNRDGDVGTLRGLEALLAARQRHFEEARQAAEEALLLMPEHTPEIALALYANALAAAGEADYDVADEAFKSVLELAIRSKLWQEAALVAHDRADMLRWAGRPYESERAARDAERNAGAARDRRTSPSTA